MSDLNGVKMVPILPGGTDLAVKRVKAAIKRGDTGAETLVSEVANAYADHADTLTNPPVALCLRCGMVNCIDCLCAKCGHRPHTVGEACGKPCYCGHPDFDPGMCPSCGKSETEHWPLGPCVQPAPEQPRKREFTPDEIDAFKWAGRSTIGRDKLIGREKLYSTFTALVDEAEGNA